jgi:hypothetical protein
MAGHGDGCLPPFVDPTRIDGRGSMGNARLGWRMLVTLSGGDATPTRGGAPGAGRRLRGGPLPAGLSEEPAHSGRIPGSAGEKVVIPKPRARCFGLEAP